MHLILTGATGLVGSGVLDSMIKMKDVTKISVLSRRAVKMADDVKDPRVNVIIHKDFEKYSPDVLSQLKGANGCVWALGVSQTQVSKEEYVKITKDYAVAASKAFQTLPSEGEPFNFVFISGGGATTEPKSSTPLYGRVKGETEQELAALRSQNPLMRAVSIRAGAVDPRGHDAIKAYLPPQLFWYKLMAPIALPAIKYGYKSLWCPTQDLGRFSTELAMGKHADKMAGAGLQMIGEFPILENSHFVKMAGVN